MNLSFFDGACLFEKRSGVSTLTKLDPQDFKLWELLPILTVNAFSGDKQERLIYAFTAPGHMCYCYNFTYNETPYSIVVVTSQPFPYLYLSFFRDTTITFDGTRSEISPECKFALLCQMLRAWKFETTQKVLVHYTSRCYHVRLDARLQTYSHFNPFRVISSKFDPVLTWKTLLLQRGKIRVYGETADIVSLACFGVASFCHPFKFRGKILLAASEYDPRLVTNDFDDYAIVAFVTSRKVPDDDRFVQTLYAERNRSSDVDLETQKMSLKVAQLHRNLELLAGRALLCDPYSDFLQTDLCATMREVIPEEDTLESFSYDELIEFMQTENGKFWRWEKRYFKETRESFLSLLPEFALANKTTEQLHVCASAVDFLLGLEQYAGDEHFHAVLKRHQSLIRGMLQ